MNLLSLCWFASLKLQDNASHEEFNAWTYTLSYVLLVNNVPHSFAERKNNDSLFHTRSGIL